MAYTLNDKGFAKWMSDNLPETLFCEYYRIYQNDVKSALIQRQKIWFGDGIEVITPAMLKDLKTQLSAKMDSQTILLVTVINYMELFVNQYSDQSVDPSVFVNSQPDVLPDFYKGEPQAKPVSKTPEQQKHSDPVPSSSSFLQKISAQTTEKHTETLSKKVTTSAKMNDRGLRQGTPEEKIDGAALHKDLSFTDYKFTQPDSFTYKGETYRSKSFADIYIKTLELLIRDYPEKMTNLPEKYRWFKYEPFGTTTSKQLSNGIYAGTNYHRYDFAKFLQKIFDDLGLPRDLMYIDSHRDYQSHSYSQNKLSRSLKTEEIVLKLNEDWSFKQPFSFTLRGKQTNIQSEKWVDLYMAVLEDLIKIDPIRMKRLPSFDSKCFSYTDFSQARFKILSNGIRAASGLKANQIEEMLERLFSHLHIAPSEFKIQAKKEVE